MGDDQVSSSNLLVEVKQFARNNTYSTLWMDHAHRGSLRREADAILADLRRRMEEMNAAPLESSWDIHWELRASVRGAMYSDALEQEQLPFEDFKKLVADTDPYQPVVVDVMTLLSLVVEAAREAESTSGDEGGEG